MSRNRLLVALCAWVALMGFVWSVFVPRGLSVIIFTLLTLSGPLLLVAVSMVRRSSQLSPSAPRTRVEATAAATGTGPRV